MARKKPAAGKKPPARKGVVKPVVRQTGGKAVDLPKGGPPTKAPVAQNAAAPKVHAAPTATSKPEPAAAVPAATGPFERPAQVASIPTNRLTAAGVRPPGADALPGLAGQP